MTLLKLVEQYEDIYNTVEIQIKTLIQKKIKYRDCKFQVILEFLLYQSIGI